MGTRLERVNSFILQELGGIVARELEMPEGVLVTFTEVSVSPDLKEAKVRVSVLPFAKKMQVLDILQRRNRLIYKLIKEKMRTKFVPSLNFVLDDTEEKASLVDKIIEKVSK